MNQAEEDTMLGRYRRAQQLEQGVYTKRVAFNTTLYPHWVGSSNCFWYVRESVKGQTFRLVDADAGTNHEAFDHIAVAAALRQASGHSVSAANLPISDLDLNFAGTVNFSAFGKRWSYIEKTRVCGSIATDASNLVVSPDGKKAAFTRDYNVWMRDLDTGREMCLTSDGDQFYVYSGSATVYGRTEARLLDLLWSPDSRRIITQRIDTREVSIGPPIVKYIADDGDHHPSIIRPNRRVAFAEDSNVEAWTILAIDVETGQCQSADYPACPVVYPPYRGFFCSGRGWWERDSRHVCFIDEPRGGKAIRLLRFDTDTGATTSLIEENTETALTLVPVSHLSTLAMPVVASNELIWFSERSGWGHLYLYELNTGAEKNPITQGDWLVRNVLHIDSDRRELIIQTAGRTEDRNPYYCDICRVHIDTGRITDIRSSDHEYVCIDERTRIGAADPTAKGVAPNGQYLVTTRSRVDQVPKSMLLDRDGKEILKLETADTSGLPANWKWPEPVMLKAADGTTDIYGVVFRPSNFDPTRSYPVIDCTYAYSAPVGSFSNNHLGNWLYMSSAAYAELGFIVVMINNRGNDGLRDSQFNHYQNPVSPMQHKIPCKRYKADCVAGIKQLAQERDYMDIDRVGVADFISVPQAVAGMLVHSDFYKVGVSINSQLDSRLSSAMNRGEENWPELETLAGNLNGKLLLIAGMLDDVMPATMTFRLVDALKMADKDFDMLLLPNLGHESTGYTTRRTWDYFVRHLLNDEPPANFQLTTGIELLMASIEDSNGKI